LLAEQPNGDFARTVARQFLFSAWQALVFRELALGADPEMAAIAAKALKEVTYHENFAADWVIRLGDGTAESRRRMEEGLEFLWRFTDELFEGDFDALRAGWDARVNAVLSEAGLARPNAVRGITGGRAGRHSEHLGHLLAQMQYLPRAFPDAVW
jgi:ring-1,2-phenylacetyl-CoA epoxidase subunit PaaC